MNAILGLTQILKLDNLNPDQHDLLHRISEAGDALLGIINDILDLSKIEAGQLSIDSRPFELIKVMERVGRLLDNSAATKGLKLEMPEIMDDQGTLIGDSLRLEQILVNLISNAIKFTERGSVVVAVLPLADLDHEVSIRFEVRDTGIGMAPQVLPKLFKPFSQGDDSITRRFGGTGLGLIISKNLVELMGGQIGAHSDLGQGSTFWFEIPFEKAASQDTVDRPVPSQSRRLQDGVPCLAGLRVLAVDDNLTNRFMIERMLKTQGAETTLAADGQEAIDILMSQPAGFDLVLMDIQMPVMDGLTATRKIRQTPALSNVPVIALSAGVQEPEKALALKAGAFDFLTKPVMLEQLIKTLAPFCKAEAETSFKADASQNNHDLIDSINETGLPVIAGIDTQQAACSCGHDQAFFLQILGLFVAEFRDTLQTVRDHLAQGNPESACQLLHNLYGSAGNLGAKALMQEAKALENLIRAGQVPNEDQLSLFAQELSGLVDASVPWIESL